jgi:predicted protein tyrosine phosphatase
MPEVLSSSDVRLSICGLDELAALRDHSVTHVLSILDPEWPDPAAFADWGRHSRQVIRFHDVIAEYPGYMAPTREHVAEILEFGQRIAGDEIPVEHFLVHCHAGISRSTASLAMLLVQEKPGSEDEVFDRLTRVRAQAWPNSRMIRFADELLGLQGRLNRGLQDHYRRQVARKPDLAAMIRRVGRDREIPD